MLVPFGTRIGWCWTPLYVYWPCRIAEMDILVDTTDRGEMMRGKRLSISCVALALLATLGGNGRLLQAQETGIEIKKPVFGGACKICPWGAIAEIVKTAMEPLSAMEPYGYDVQVCYNCSTMNAPRLVAGAEMPPEWKPSANPDIPPSQSPLPPDGPVDFGATINEFLWWAYQGTHDYAGEGPRENLRLLADIQSPYYYIVAVKADLGITDLSQIRQKRWPLRVLTDGHGPSATVLDYYGLTREAIESAGGHIGEARNREDRANFDVILHGGTLENTPEFNAWYEVSQKFDLHYLELPGDLLDQLAEENDMERRMIPNGLLRGIDHPIPSVGRSGTAIYCRDDAPDDFAYAVAKAIDEHQDLLQWSHINFSYNLRTVWKAYGIPLHPGAARYYRERNYME